MSVIALLLAACGSEGGIHDLVPVLAFEPDDLPFGDVGPPLSSQRDLLVENVGAADLEVALGVDGGAGTFTISNTELTLRPGEIAAVPMTFTPTTFADYAATVHLDTNDPDHRHATVALSGRGVDLPFPDIVIEPGLTIERPTVAPGTEDTFTFVVRNVGDAPLLLGAITLDGPPVFDLVYAPSLFTLGPGNGDSVVVAYSPTTAVGEVATVTLPSNDPDEHTIDVLLVGNGGGTFDRPVAAIDCPTEVLLTGPEWVHLDGSGSFDPAGALPLTWSWTVASRPPASDAAIPLDPTDTPAIDLYTDVAGEWTVDLVVTNTFGTASLPTSCVFGARPEDDLHVELSWSTPEADVDLHLVQDGSLPFDCPGDCFFDAPNPEWAVVGDPDDDPRLDIDDLAGFGPENINLAEPAAGSYDVFVHLYNPRDDTSTTATVEVWLGGLAVWTGSAVLDEDGALWEVGTIVWPAGTFTPSGTAITIDGHGGCN
jgi:hypothetical protein